MNSLFSFCFWFESIHPRRLAFYRIIFFSLMGVFYANRLQYGYQFISTHPISPITLFSFFEVSIPSDNLLNTMYCGFLLSALTSALGLLTRISIFTNFILALLCIGLPHNFLYLHHRDGLLVVFIGIFLFSNCGAWLSLDSLFFGRFIKKRSPDDGWALQLMVTILCINWFSAFYEKMVGSGLEWLSSENIYSYFTSTFFLFNIKSLVFVERMIVSFSKTNSVWTLLGALVLIAEGGHLLYLFFQKKYCALLSLVSLFGIGVAMNIVFWEFLICNIVWIALLMPNLGEFPRRTKAIKKNEYFPIRAGLQIGSIVLVLAGFLWGGMIKRDVFDNKKVVIKYGDLSEERLEEFLKE